MRWVRFFRRPRAQGPGLAESIGWTLGYLLAQVLAFAGFMAAFVLAAFHAWPADLRQVIDLLLKMDFDRSFAPLGVTNLLCLFLIVPAVCWRLGSRTRDVIKLGSPDRAHIVLIAGSVIPLAVVSEQLYRWSFQLWSAIAEIAPTIQPWSRSNLADVVMRFAVEEPYPILVVAIALGPAIGEELVFRGLIGNGLIGRWGRRRGIWLTSLLFAAAHGFPPHALATIPIGLYLHHVYLASGCYWTPVLVHFLNNLLVITLARYNLLESLPCSPLLLVSAAAYVLMTSIVLDRSRQIEPAFDVSARDDRVRRGGWTPAWTAAAVLAFTVTFVWTALSGS